ncbi:hypothetical protein PSACC_01592 [Paramicrosporidium saccamoebae]|uniref:Uncharacterized protein n=1 Tax=Paramicrosporidium saccamoebae TaxID=1246581 RepID=A0A2H9TLF7_9FUNG|nr:hypothetical protein PSACC_01592 [Paramicrosporidium saccamoebae]
MVYYTAIPLLLLLFRGTHSAVASSSSDSDDFALPASVEANVPINFDTLIKAGGDLDFTTLESQLQGGDPESISKQCQSISIIVAKFCMLKNTENVVQQALDAGCYKALQLIAWIIGSVHEIKANTRHLIPQMVKSSKALQYLLHVGYDQIPRPCLYIKNDLPAVYSNYAYWLAKRNCLSLLQEMLKENPNFNRNYAWFRKSAIKGGSLDVLEWLYKMKKIKLVPAELVCLVVKKGDLKTIKWIIEKFGHCINWDHVLRQSYSSCRSRKTIRYIQKNTSAILPDHYIPSFLAAKGNLPELQATIASSRSTFSWKKVANAAAEAGHTNILDWVYQTSCTLPSSKAVEQASRNY